MSTNTDDRTLGEMFAELSQGFRTLVQQELQLAKTELTDKASTVGRAAGLIIGGGLVAYGGLLTIIAAGVLILIALRLPAWAGALAGGVLTTGAGYVLIRSGLAAFRAQELKPTQTIDTLKEDAQWLKTQTK